MKIENEINLYEEYVNNVEKIENETQFINSLHEQRLYVKLLSKNALPPKMNSGGSAGYDLYAPETCVIKSKCITHIPLDVVFVIPEGYYGRIAPRSGLASKHCINVMHILIVGDGRSDRL
jgi:dUTP pyrophosphatase